MKLKRITAFFCALCMCLTCVLSGVGFSPGDFLLTASAAVVRSGTLGRNITWKLDDEGTLIISGKGSMGNYSRTNPPWPWKDNCVVKNVIINKGITDIGSYVFYNCNCLMSVTISDGVTSIGSHSFCNCYNLTSITIPDSLTSIDYRAFYFCKSLESITIPANVTSIGSEAFYNCENLVSISISDGIESIGSCAFLECDSLALITIPDSVISIDRGAFACNNLGSITIKNPNCEVYDSESTISDTATIYGYPGSTAEAYAEKYDREFVALDENYKPDNPKPDEHVHSYEETVTEPTCTEQGYTVYTCKDCGHTYKDNYTDALGHDYGDWLVKTPPTCISDGILHRKCSRCDSEETETIEAIGHNYEEKVIAPTCTEQGYTVYTCKNCDDSYTDDYVDALGHSFGEWFVERPAKCTEEGNKFHICERCDYKETSVIDPEGHTAGEETVEKEPTCIETGLRTIRCTKCNAVIKSKVIPANGHDYETEYVKPDCLSKGYIVHTCKVCDDTYKDSYEDALGHDLGEWNVKEEPDCTKEGTEYRTCSRCDYEENNVVPPTGHNPGDWSVEREATCTENGAKIKRCTVCDEILETEEIPATGHIYKDTVISPKCTEQGYTSYVCEICGDSYNDDYTEPTGHKFTEWIKTTIPQCASEGAKSRTCSVCDYKETVAISSTGHTVGDLIIEKEPSCTVDGLKVSRCKICDTVISSEEIPATGHKFVDRVVEPTCTKQGYTIHKCSACDYSYADSYIEIVEHMFDEWKIQTLASCTVNGTESRLCKVCGYEDVHETPAMGHLFEEWKTEKEPTVFENGVKSRVCKKCSFVEYGEIEKRTVDIKQDSNYGIANFTVVDAKSLEPLSDVSLQFSSDTEGECIIATDDYGQARQILPVGRNSISVYKDGYLVRNINVDIINGEQDIPKIGLSTMPLVDGKLTVTEMTYDEIVAAGIDVSDPANNHVYKYAAEIQFGAEIDLLQFITLFNGEGDFLGWLPTSYDPNPEPTEPTEPGDSWYKPDRTHGRCIFYHDKDDDHSGGVFDWGIGVPFTLSNGTDVTVYPVSEKFYLIIYGEVKWLKEMFNVQLLVINNSNTDTIEDCTAQLNLPDGLSLASMVNGKQNLVQKIEHIEEGGSDSVNWYVRGDKEGNYDITATLDGKMMPFGEEFSYTYQAKDPIKVYAGGAMHMTFAFPDSAFYNEDYSIQIILENVSEKTLYGVTHEIKGLKQGKITHYSDGSEKEEIYNYDKDLGKVYVNEFNPGDKIVIEMSTNILFQSEIIEEKLDKLRAMNDGFEQFYQGFRAIERGLEIAKSFGAMLDNASKNIEDIIKDDTIDISKRSALKDLDKEILSVLEDSDINDNDVLCAISAFNSDEFADARALISDLADSTKVTSLIKNIAASEITDAILTTHAALHTDDKEDVNVFDAVDNLISMIPVRFFVNGFTVSTLEGSTTEIPYSVQRQRVGLRDYNVCDISLGKYIYDSTIIALGEVDVPWYLRIFTNNDPTGYENAQKEIKAAIDKTSHFNVSDAKGSTTFKAWVEKASDNTGKKMLSDTSDNLFSISVNNDSAVYEDGVVTFTGSGTISVTPNSMCDGTLFVEHDGEIIKSYELHTVEKHDCHSDKWITFIKPSDGEEGYRAKLCDVCDSLIEIETIADKTSTETTDSTTEQVTTITTGDTSVSTTTVTESTDTSSEMPTVSTSSVSSDYKSVDDYMVELVEGYTSDYDWEQFEIIMDSKKSYEEKERLCYELFHDRGLTNIEDSVKYFRDVKPQVDDYLYLITNENFMAFDWYCYLNKTSKGNRARDWLCSENWLSEKEYGSILNLDDYNAEKYPTVKKRKYMLEKFLTSRSDNSEISKHINSFVRYVENVLKLNGITVDSEKEVLIDRFVECKDESELNELWSELLIRNGKEITDIKIPGGNIAKFCGNSDFYISTENFTGTSVVQLYKTEESFTSYYEVCDFLTNIADSSDMSVDMRYAAMLVLKDIDKNYSETTANLLKTVLISSEDVFMVSAENLHTLSGTSDFSLFMSKLLENDSDLIEAIDDAEYYAELGILYSQILKEDRIDFRTDSDVENAWKFFTDYKILWNLRNKGEECYAEMDSTGMYSELIKHQNQTDDSYYKFKDSVANSTIEYLGETLFDTYEGEGFIEVEYCEDLIIECPVDVVIKTKAGDTVAVLKDGAESDISNDYGRFAVVYNPFTEEYTKVIRLKTDEIFDIEITAVGDGNVSYQRLSAGAENIVAFNERVKKGDSIVLDTDTDNTTYDVVNDDGITSKELLVVEDKVAEEISINAESIELEAGDTAVPEFTVTPDNISNLELEWISSNDKVAVVKDGVIKGLRAGTADIYVRVLTNNPDDIIEDTITVNVTGNIPLGDVNGDGMTDASDASQILAIYAVYSTGGTPKETEEQILSADVNSDGMIDASDASTVLAYYAYLSTGGTDDIEAFMAENVT